MKLTDSHKHQLRRLQDNTPPDAADWQFLQHLLTTTDYRVHLFKPSVACLNAVNRILGRKAIRPGG